jgi:hypothetical protein
MQITSNTTGYLTDLFVTTDKQGRKRCVVVLKATFEVDPDGECRPAAEQMPFVYADEHYGDPGTTSIRYESEFAPMKPRADVLVNASAIPPSGRPVTQLEVALEGPGISKRAIVTGDRVWERGLLGVKPSDPVPFTSMPIVWDRAFGGSDLTHEKESKRGSEMRNLVGLGYRTNGDQESLVGTAIPNIERIDRQIGKWSDKPEPIGFGPLGRGWQPRIKFAGTYDQKWMDETLPFLPEDFDDRYFQAAPLDQQIAQLPAGATFTCSNMSEGGRFVARLPSMHARVDFSFDNRTETRVLAPDTLIVEPNLKRLIMVGRTSVPLPRKFTTLRGIEVGPRARRPGNKAHYKNLAEAIKASRGPR